MSAEDQRIVRVGLIGLGEIAQVSHINVLNSLSDYFHISYMCDPSEQALKHCSQRVFGDRPKTTTNPEELCSSPDVDVVVLCNATAFHPSHALLALKNNKSVLVEKPIALCYRDIDAIIAAERTSTGKVFVGYQRRYAEAFLDAVKEVGGMDKILYARVRDIIGPNSTFVNQSGTFPKKFTDYKTSDTETMTTLDSETTTHALHEFGVKPTPQSRRMLFILGALATHDFSTMRELLGMPTRVLGASLGFPFWSTLFDYGTFTLTYESGIHDVPVFDAHIEVYGKDKIVRVDYDTPYVRGLPVTMTVQEKVEGAKGDGFRKSVTRKTYEDGYTAEILELYRCVVSGEAPKTGAVDARSDVELFEMVLRAGCEAASL